MRNKEAKTILYGYVVLYTTTVLCTSMVYCMLYGDEASQYHSILMYSKIYKTSHTL